MSCLSAGVYQLPGVADVVDVFADVPQPVGVPRQGGVDGYGDDLTPQWKAEYKNSLFTTTFFYFYFNLIILTLC